MTSIRLTSIVLATLIIPVFGKAQATDPSLPEAFYSGSLVLEYSFFGKGASGAKTLKELHDQDEWASLARSVIDQKSQGYDVYYYYLAASAKKLGHEAAAKAFAEKALTSNEKCEEVPLYDVCQGVNVKRSVNALLGLNKLTKAFPSSGTLDQLSQLSQSP